MDMANAFDRVNHSFLFSVPRKLGFLEVFLKWIQVYIISPWIAPFMKGRLIIFFQGGMIETGVPFVSFAIYPNG